MCDNQGPSAIDVVTAILHLKRVMESADVLCSLVGHSAYSYFEDGPEQWESGISAIQAVPSGTAEQWKQLRSHISGAHEELTLAIQMVERMKQLSFILT
jgi:hypothetical protein